MQQYPAIQTELFTHDGLPDLATNRIDVAFQTMGLREPDYIAHELGQCRSILCASEEYIRIHGRPRHPKDLLDHELIGHLQMPTTVRFTQNTEEVEIAFAGRFSSNSASVLLDAVRTNLGIAILPDLALLTDLNRGRLVELLPDWQCPSVQIDAMTDHRYLSRCVKTFLNFVKMDLKQNKVRMQPIKTGTSR